MQSSTGFLSPGTTGQNTSAGNSNFDNRDNIKIEDGIFCTTDIHSTNHVKDVAARIRLNTGAIGSTDKKNPNNWNSTLQYITYGGDLWGLALTPVIVNSINFGFAFRVGGGILSSYYLLAYNFGFVIPPDATIVSVTVKVKRKDALGAGGGGSTIGYIDHIAMQIVYDVPPPPSPPSLPPKKMFHTGFSCFVSQYVLNKRLGRTPFKTPTALY